MKTKNHKSGMTAEVRKFSVVAVLLFGLVISTFANRIIAGKITDANDQSPIPGVSVVLKGTSIGTLSDAYGFYRIEVPDQGAVLVFSFLGYSSKEIKVKNHDNMNVELVAETTELQELVIIGYGQDMDEAKSEDLSSSPGNAQIRIRGCATISNTSNQQFNAQPVYYNPSEESYSTINENGFKQVGLDPLSTFSIDVDKASYTNIRRFINDGQIPPQDAVRIEEMVNYFNYEYPQPVDEHPFSINTEYADCPWQSDHKLLQIGLQGKKIAIENLPASNLVFLLDVSGSMDEQNKLPLVKSAFKLLINNLREQDRVAIVVYAGAAGVVLEPTKGNNKNKIVEALNSLQAGGSTAGGAGIELAYKLAQENFVKGGNNRVILATDGDFNVGISSEGDLERMIEDRRKSGVFLTCLGFGMGNYKDSKLEVLADKGNGNYAYIDDLTEATRVFVNEFGGTLFTIAKDVKIQIEFNPNLVQAYRLVGYENRMLNNEDFKNDAKDAGELGSGHTVTAIYEIIPVGVKSHFVQSVDELKYQQPTFKPSTDNGSEVATVKFRYKKPDGDNSIEMVHPISNQPISFESSSENIRFASSVVMFGMILRHSEFKGKSNLNQIIKIAENARQYDPEGYRGEFVRLVRTTRNMDLTQVAE